MKRFIVLLFLLTQTVAFADDDSRDSKKIEDAQKEVFGLIQQMIEGKKEKEAVRVEFENLMKEWSAKGIAPEILISSWNSYLILSATFIVKRYQATLWSSPSDRDPEILDGYGEALKSIGFSAELLKLHGRGSESFSKAIEVFQFLKERRDFVLAMGGKESEEGLDLSEIKYFELSEEQLDQWDLYLGEHQLPSGEEMPNQTYRAKLLSLWEGHHKALQNYVERVESRGLWQMLEGALRGDLEDPNQIEIQGAVKLMGQYRSQMIRLGVSGDLIQEMLKKEKEAHKYAGLLFDEDISQVKWATVGVAMAPLIPLSMAGGVALGLSVKASAALAGIPMLVMGVKGVGSFVIRGLFNQEHFTGRQFYNDLMPGLTSALPFSAVLPLCAGGITAIAGTEVASTTMIAKTGISAGQALTAGSFFILIGYGVIRGGASVVEGISELARRDAERGTLLLWDGTVDIAASLLFLKFARPGTEKAPPSSQESGGQSGSGGTAGNGGGTSPSPEVGSVGRYFPERASATLPAREGNISPHTQNYSVRGGQEKGESAHTMVALLEKPASLRDLLEIPETLPPDDILFSGTNILPSPQSPSFALPKAYPVWTGTPILDDGNEEVEIIRRDDEGNVIVRRIVRVKKGSTEEEIWQQMGYRLPGENIVSLRGQRGASGSLTQASSRRDGKWINLVLSSSDGELPEEILDEVKKEGNRTTWQRCWRLVVGPSPVVPQEIGVSGVRGKYPIPITPHIRRAALRMLMMITWGAGLRGEESIPSSIPIVSSDLAREAFGRPDFHIFEEMDVVVKAIALKEQREPELPLITEEGREEREEEEARRISMWEQRWFTVLINTPDGTIPEDILKEVARLGTKKTYDRLLGFATGPSSEIRRGAIRMLDWLVREVELKEDASGLLPAEYRGIPTVLEFNNWMINHRVDAVRKDAEEILLGEWIGKEVRRVSQRQQREETELFLEEPIVFDGSERPEKSLEQTLTELKNSNGRVRLEALEYLYFQLERAQNDALNQLSTGFNTGFNIVDRAVVEALLSALSDPNPAIRMKAAFALGLLGNEEEGAIEPELKEQVLESLRRTLRNDDPDPSVRVAAADALASLFDFEVVEEIIHLFIGGPLDEKGHPTNPSLLLNAKLQSFLYGILYRFATTSSQGRVVREALRKVYQKTQDAEVRGKIWYLLLGIRDGLKDDNKDEPEPWDTDPADQ